MCQRELLSEDWVPLACAGIAIGLAGVTMLVLFQQEMFVEEGGVRQRVAVTVEDAKIPMVVTPSWEPDLGLIVVFVVVVIHSNV